MCMPTCKLLHLITMEQNSPNPNEVDFEVSDFFEFNHWVEEYLPFSLSPAGCSNMQDPMLMPAAETPGSGLQGESGSAREKNGKTDRFAFRTKTQIEILEDGYKWRKYGKKMVKNSPNPRNYYKCSALGCCVKKRVERDNSDPNYVITTYEGQHNHHCVTIANASTGSTALGRAWDTKL